MKTDDLVGRAHTQPASVTTSGEMRHEDLLLHGYGDARTFIPYAYLPMAPLPRAGFSGEAKDLAESSLRLFLGEWNRKGWVCENYSALTGTCDDPRLSSDPFHSWGGLLALPAFVEKTSKLQAR